jgi:hypothetical protein
MACMLKEKTFEVKQYLFKPYYSVQGEAGP